MNDNYLKGRKWEHLIKHYMPHLRIFNFQHHRKIPFKYPETCQQLIKQLSLYKDSTRGLFSSIKPYKRKDLHLNYINNQCKSSRLIENSFNSVRHTYIGNQYKSLLSTIVSTESISIPHFYTFNERNMSCDIIIKMLQLTPNCYKLKLESLSSIESNEDFQYLSKKTKIQDVTIKLCTFEDIQFLIKLYCRLEYLHINVYDKDSQPIISYILDKNENNPYLHLLNIQSSSDPWDVKIINSATAVRQSNEVSYDMIDMIFIKNL
ncbi:unnamed protein product [Adineta steineri]|nr:unnamed protein product [Adineta steineri]